MEIKFFYLPPFRASPVCLKGRAIRLVVKFYFRISGFMFSSYGGEGGGEIRWARKSKFISNIVFVFVRVIYNNFSAC